MSRSTHRAAGRLASRTAVVAVTGALVVPAVTGVAGASGTTAGAPTVKAGDSRVAKAIAAAHERLVAKGGQLTGSRKLGTRSTAAEDSTGAAAKAAPTSGPVTVMIQVTGQPAGLAYTAARGRGVAAATAAAKDARAHVDSQLAAVRSHLGAKATQAHVLYTVHNAYSGIAVRTDASRLAALGALPGVESVQVMTAKTASNAHSVPLIQAPQAWSGAGETGEGVRIGIIDTGIDYTHADFGGPGTTDAYEAANAADTVPPAPGSYDPAKFDAADSYDLAGDAYSAGDTDPVPDPNPLDCNGHGSHVSGTAAGFGVTSDGETYSGDYSSSTDFGQFAAPGIGPGVAPQAILVGLRVFGCEGSTNLVAEALDRAADPNGDGNFADRLDVVNMSLGSDFGSPQDPDAVAAGNLQQIGTEVVVAAGNAGDIYAVDGSPGNDPHVLSVAASDDGFDVYDSLHVDRPARIAGDYAAQRSIAYDWQHEGGIANATVVPMPGTLDASDYSVNNKDGCDAFTPEQRAAVAGNVVFLEWTDDGTVRRCGSAVRSGNARAAGAVGAVFGDDQSRFGAGITGDPVIPVMQTNIEGRDAIRSVLYTHYPQGGADQTASYDPSGNTVQADLLYANRNSFPLSVPGATDTLADFSSRGTHNAGNVKPDVAAPGFTIFSVANGTGNEGMNDNGTSMATPHTAGLAALVRGLHPDWSSAEVKAAIMNTADGDLDDSTTGDGNRYAPNRVGSGRIDAATALATPAVAAVSGDDGAVSVSFGPVAVTGPMTLTKTVTVTNKSMTPRTYAASYSAITTVPGVSYTVSPSSVSLAARRSANVTVTFKVTDPRALTKTHDPTVALEQGGLPRQFVADASGLLLLSSAGVPTLRVPVYSAPRPAATMTQQSSVTVPRGDGGTAPLVLSGSGVSQGPLDDQGNPADESYVQSLVSGFELQGTSPRKPTCTPGSVDPSVCTAWPEEASADLRYVGASSAYGLLNFGISTWGTWRVPASYAEYDVVIDTNGDGDPDYVIYNDRFTDTDIPVAVTVDLSDGSTADIEPINDALGDTDTDLFDSDAMVLSADLGTLGIDTEAASAPLSYTVEAYGGAGFSDAIGESAGDDPKVFDPLHPALSVTDSQGDPMLLSDDEPQTATVHYDRSAATAQSPDGLLLIHHHDVDGKRAQTVAVNEAPPTPGVSLAVGTAPSNDAAYATRDSGPFQSLGGTLVGAPSVTLFNGSPFYVATGGNGGLYYRTDTVGWRPLAAASSTCLAPSALVESESTLEVACVGSNGLVYTSSTTVSSSSNAYLTRFTRVGNPQGGEIGGGPALVHFGTTTSLLVAGADHSTGDVWIKPFGSTPSAAGAWQAYGALTCGDEVNAAATSDVLWVGCATDSGALVVSRQDGSAAPQQITLGGAILGQPGIATTDDGQTATIFVVGTNHVVYRTAVKGTSASVFVRLGGQIDDTGMSAVQLVQPGA